MTYEEAQKQLLLMGESQIEGGYVFINRISPLKQKDSIKFTSTLTDRPVNEEEMKSFSFDGQYEVRSFRKSTFRHL